MKTYRGSSHCGIIAAFYRPRADPTHYMVNARCLEGVDLGSVERVAFDGQSWELRPDARYTGIWNDGSSRSPR